MEPADSAWNLQHAVSDVCLCEGLHTSKLGVLQLFLCFLFHWQQVPRSPALWPRRRGAWQENKDCVAEFCGLTLLQCFTLVLGFPSSTVCGCHAATCSAAWSSACGCHTTIWSSMSPSTWSASSTAVFVFGLSYFRSRVHYSYKRNWFIITTILGSHQIWKSGFTSKFCQGSYFNLQAWLP